MDGSKKPNKIREIVRLQQILKKWRKKATSSSSSSSSSKPCNKKSIQLMLRRTLSFSDKTNTSPSPHNNNNSNIHDQYYSSSSSSSAAAVPKGYLAVSVGEEQRRFVIPTEYLGRAAFRGLLREAEEEFGFEQTGVLRIPCDVAVFERVLQGMESADDSNNNNHYLHYCSSEMDQLGFSHHSDHSPMCR